MKNRIQLPPLTAEEILDSALDPEQALIAKEERARMEGILPSILIDAPRRIDHTAVLGRPHDMAFTLLVPHREDRVELPKDADIDAKVAEDFKVTRERLRGIEAKALQKLRTPSRSKKLKAFLESNGA